ncbi:MAG: hypothetical protein JEZ08_00950 [Clostridiales bacterium]|nr:hypothetical protein [Clostridiales bacterium]
MYYDILEGYSSSKGDASIINDTDVPYKMYALLDDLTSESEAEELNAYLVIVKDNQFNDKRVLLKTLYI